MYDSAKALSNGIVSQYPDKFKMSNMPSGMPHTGLGGAQKTDYFEWMLAAIVALAAATVIFAERRANKEHKDGIFKESQFWLSFPLKGR